MQRSGATGSGGKERHSRYFRRTLPVRRGMALLLDDRSAYLRTPGYVPQLDTYVGPETPNPLLISVFRSKKAKPDIRTVLADIMGLTKINYNSCNFNDAFP